MIILWEVKFLDLNFASSLSNEIQCLDNPIHWLLLLGCLHIFIATCSGRNLSPWLKKLENNTHDTTRHYFRFCAGLTKCCLKNLMGNYRWVEGLIIPFINCKNACLQTTIERINFSDKAKYFLSNLHTFIVMCIRGVCGLYTVGEVKRILYKSLIMYFSCMKNMKVSCKYLVYQNSRPISMKVWSTFSTFQIASLLSLPCCNIVISMYLMKAEELTIYVV